MTDLTTLDDAKALLGITDSGSDALISRLVSAASATICSYCRRRDFGLASYTDTLDGPADSVLQLPSVPVASVASVTLDPYGDQPQVIDGSNFLIDAARGRIKLKPSNSQYHAWFPEGVQNVQVEYTAGYADIPVDLANAADMVVQQLYAQRGDELLAQSERLGDYSVTLADCQRVIASSLGIKSVLDRYIDWGA